MTWWCSGCHCHCRSAVTAHKPVICQNNVIHPPFSFGIPCHLRLVFGELFILTHFHTIRDKKSLLFFVPSYTGHVALNVHWSECSTAHWAQYRPDHGQTHSALSLSARTGFAPPGVPSTRCKGWSEELWNFNNCVAMAIMTMALGI